MLGIIYLCVYLASGILIIRCLLPGKCAVVRVWLGGALGMLLMMWLPALWAFLVRFSVKGHLIALLSLGLIDILCICLRDKKTPVRVFDRADRKLLLLILCTALPLTLLGAYLQYTHCLRPDNGARFVGQSTYGDLPLHLGIITSLRNAKFPADYSILPGERLTYPFLMDSFSTSFVLFGMELNWAVCVPGTLMMGMVFAGYLILTARMTSSRRAVVLAFLFLFINGGLGFLYSIDTLGVSNGSMDVNPLQAGTWMERLDTIIHGWYQTPANHADFTYYNLRWSNIIVDMLVPQRTFLGGWCMLLPCIYLLYDGFEDRNAPSNIRQIILLGIMAGGMPLLHTHSFLALGLLSAGWMLFDLIRGGKLWRWALYGVLACALAAPQLFGWTFAHTSGNSGFVNFQFNWVNNSGGNGLRDGYLWFYIKNIGLPVILLLLSLCEKNKRRRWIAAGAFAIFIVAELIVFQPNEYDNNKLFYVWWALCAVLAAEYAVEVYDSLRKFASRRVLAVLLADACFTTGTLSIARECTASYMMFSRYEMETAVFAEENTQEDATFLCWTQHINPISALAGRNIVCGPGLWLAMHGYDLSGREADIRRFYADPAHNTDVLTKYSVDYIAVGEHERANLVIDERAIETLYTLVFVNTNGSMRIYAVEGGA